MDTYTLNSMPYSTRPPTKEEHRRSLTIALIAAGAAVIIGILYWWSIASRPQSSSVETVDEQARLRAEIISILNSTPHSPSSPEDIERITQQLSSAPKAEATAEQRASIINQLNSGR